MYKFVFSGCGYRQKGLTGYDFQIALMFLMQNFSTVSPKLCQLGQKTHLDMEHETTKRNPVYAGFLLVYIGVKSKLVWFQTTLDSNLHCDIQKSAFG